VVLHNVWRGTDTQRAILTHQRSRHAVVTNDADGPERVVDIYGHRPENGYSNTHGILADNRSRSVATRRHAIRQATAPGDLGRQGE